MKACIDAALEKERFLAQVSVALGLVGLALASIGLYGVLSYTVNRRTREIGVRLALGAQRRDVLLMIMRQGLSLAVLGALLAAPVLLALSHVHGTGQESRLGCAPFARAGNYWPRCKDRRHRSAPIG